MRVFPGAFSYKGPGPSLAHAQFDPVSRGLYAAGCLTTRFRDRIPEGGSSPEKAGSLLRPQAGVGVVWE